MNVLNCHKPQPHQSLNTLHVLFIFSRLLLITVLPSCLVILQRIGPPLLPAHAHTLCPQLYNNQILFGSPRPQPRIGTIFPKLFLPPCRCITKAFTLEERFAWALDIWVTFLPSSVVPATRLLWSTRQYSPFTSVFQPQYCGKTLGKRLYSP